MPTLQESQQIEQLRGLIVAEEHFLTTLVGGLPDLGIREKRATQLADLAKDDPQRIWEHQSATKTLEKLCRQRSLIEERIAGANHRVKLAKTRLTQQIANLDFGASPHAGNRGTASPTDLNVPRIL